MLKYSPAGPLPECQSGWELIAVPGGHSAAVTSVAEWPGGVTEWESIDFAFALWGETRGALRPRRPPVCREGGLCSAAAG